jgi:hypothetical protein
MVLTNSWQTFTLSAIFRPVCACVATALSLLWYNVMPLHLQSGFILIHDRLSTA